jgi:uncharacterized protein
MSISSSEALEIYTDRIVSACDPDQIILFGSHARNQANSESDLDLLILTSTEIEKRKLRVLLHNRLRGVPFPKDIIVANTLEVANGTASEIVKAAISEGKSVYRRPSLHG